MEEYLAEAERALSCENITYADLCLNIVAVCCKALGMPPGEKYHQLRKILHDLIVREYLAEAERALRKSNYGSAANFLDLIEQSSSELGLKPPSEYYSLMEELRGKKAKN